MAIFSEFDPQVEEVQPVPRQVKLTLVECFFGREDEPRTALWIHGTQRGHLFAQGDPGRDLRLEGVRFFEVDAHPVVLTCWTNCGGALPTRMRDAADDARWPERLAKLTGKDGGARSPQLGQCNSRALSPGHELLPPTFHGARHES